MTFLQTDDNTKIYYEVIGNKEPVFLLNGLLANPYTWKNTIIDKLSNNFQCILHCYRGQDFTEISNEFTYEDILQDLKKLIDHLNYKKVNLIGDALGVSVALSFTSAK